MVRFLHAFAVSVIVSSAASAATFGTNLIQNGGAETGDLTGWTGPGVSVATENPGGALEVFSGTYAFTGAFGATSDELIQTIDVGALSAQIDTGTVEYTLSGQLQNRRGGTLTDRVIYYVLFLNEFNGFLGSSAVLEDPVWPDGNFTYSFESDTGLVPIGTRFAQVELLFSRNGGSSTDAFADDLSLSVNAAPIPLPAGGALLLGGLGALSLMRRRRG